MADLIDKQDFFVSFMVPRTILICDQTLRRDNDSSAVDQNDQTSCEKTLPDPRALDFFSKMIKMLCYLKSKNNNQMQCATDGVCNTMVYFEFATFLNTRIKIFLQNHSIVSWKMNIQYKRYWNSLVEKERHFVSSDNS